MAEVIAPTACALSPDAEWSSITVRQLEEIGYEVMTPAIRLVSLRSLMFSAMARRSDLVILSAEYFHDQPISVIREYINAISEARAHGCMVVLVGLKPDMIDQNVRHAAMTYLKEFVVFKDDSSAAVSFAEQQWEQGDEKIIAVADGKHSRSVDNKGRKVVELGPDGELSLLVMDSLAIPHPFDGEDHEAKMRFILGYNEGGYVAVCGFTNENDAPPMSGYIVPEVCLGLPEGWQKEWKSKLLFSGLTTMQRDDWTHTWPSADTEQDMMIVGDPDYQIDGSVVVQMTPHCLCVRVPAEEIPDGAVRRS